MGKQRQIYFSPIASGISQLFLQLFPFLLILISFLPLSYLLHRNLLGEVLIESNGDAVLPGSGSCSSCPSGRSVSFGLLVTFLKPPVVALSNQKVEMGC